MGKRIVQQRRGRGTHTYRVPERKFKPLIGYGKGSGKVIDIVNDPLRNAPLAKIIYDDSTEKYLVAPEGLRVGQTTDVFVRSISEIPEGTKVFAIETYPNSGPKLCRTPGAAATVVTKTEKDCTILLPSKKTKKIHPGCRVCLGIPAGDGIKEKPILKAGKAWIIKHKRGKLYPRTSGVSMNALNHPYGGGYSGLGKHKTVSRNTPPGRKVGSLAARRTGRKKKK